LKSGSPDEVQQLLRSLRTQNSGAVIVIRDFLTHTLINEINRMSAELEVAVVAEQASFVEAGALMSYGPDLVDVFRQAAVYVDQIIKGEKAGDLPIQTPAKLELAINLKTAKTLGLEVLPALLARADQVFE
jgi:putative ABC transport system substrate-binding protein